MADQGLNPVGPPTPPNTKLSEATGLSAGTVTGTSTENSSTLYPSRPPTPLSAGQRFKAHINATVDFQRCIAVSIYACFLTGYTSAISFSACYIWCGFQTGNVAQLGLALARTFAPTEYRTYGLQLPDQQALVSLLSFLVGTSLGRFEHKLGGGRCRLCLVCAAFAQCLMAMAGALAAHYAGESGVALERGAPSWETALGQVSLGFISATMGLQGIVGKRVGSPMNTTVVLTTTWVELFNDPLLGALRPVPSRDIRIAGVLSLLFGAFVSRAILQTSAGPAGAIAVLVGLRLIQMFWWAWIPVVAVKPKGADGKV